MQTDTPCKLDLFDCPPPTREAWYGVLSFYSGGGDSGHWVGPRNDWWVTRTRAEQEATRRQKIGHTHISIVVLPGTET